MEIEEGLEMQASRRHRCVRGWGLCAREWRLRLLSVISLTIFAVACSSSEREHSDQRLPASVSHRPQLGTAREALVTTTTLEASGDTYLRSGAPNQNAGGDTRLSLQSVGRHPSAKGQDLPMESYAL
jgi:hypothetical protein